jgi:hypothetical protein
MKKVMLAAMAASVLVGSVFGADSSQTLCSSMGNIALYPNQLSLDQRNIKMTDAEITKKIIEIITMKAQSPAIEKNSIKNRSTKEAEEWIKKAIETKRIGSHFYNYIRTFEKSTSELYLKMYRFSAAIDYQAKNDQDLRNEVIRRNVALHVYLATKTRNVVQFGAPKMPTYTYHEALRIDSCDENIDRIGFNDFYTPLVFTEVASGYEMTGFMLDTFETGNSTEIIAAIRGEHIWRAKKTFITDQEEMMDNIIQELKKTKVIK